jgi:hypothetical protein
MLARKLSVLELRDYDDWDFDRPAWDLGRAIGAGREDDLAFGEKGFLVAMTIARRPCGSSRSTRVLTWVAPLVALRPDEVGQHLPVRPPRWAPSSAQPSKSAAFPRM